MSNPPEPEQGEREDTSIDTDQLDRLEAALLTLPRFRREVFLATRIDNLTYAEIAEITGVSERRIRREMSRALLGIVIAMDNEPMPKRWWNRW